MKLLTAIFLTYLIQVSLCDLPIEERKALSDLSEIFGVPDDLVNCETYPEELFDLECNENQSHVTKIEFKKKPKYEIKPSFGSFIALESFITKHDIIGIFPREFSSLVTLKELVIHSKSLPTMFSLSKLLQLEYISIRTDKAIIENIHELLSLQNLKHLEIHSSATKFEFPKELGSQKKITHLEFSLGTLNGSIPETISNLENLENLILNGGLVGSIPVGIADLSSLNYLDLSGNKLTGTIPRSLLKLNFQTLNLGNNQLEGTIPHGLYNSKDLVELKLNNNYFSGNIPYDVFDGRTEPFSVDLSSNCFDQCFPPVNEQINCNFSSNLIFRLDPFCPETHCESSKEGIDYKRCHHKFKEPEIECTFEECRLLEEIQIRNTIRVQKKLVVPPNSSKIKFFPKSLDVPAFHVEKGGELNFLIDDNIQIFFDNVTYNNLIRRLIDGKLNNDYYKYYIATGRVTSFYYLNITLHIPEKGKRCESINSFTSNIDDNGLFLFFNYDTFNCKGEYSREITIIVLAVISLGLAIGVIVLAVFLRKAKKRPYSSLDEL